MWKEAREAGLFGKRIVVFMPHEDINIVPHHEAKLMVFSDGVIIDERPHYPFLYEFRLGDKRNVNQFLSKLSANSTVYLKSSRVKIAKKVLERNVKIERDGIYATSTYWHPKEGHSKTDYTKYTFMNCEVVL